MIGFDTDLGPIGSFESASLAEVQADVKMKFTLGIDLNEPIGGAFHLSTATPLTALNGPDGSTTVTYDHDQNSATPELPRWPLADRPTEFDSVRFTLSDGTSFDVNFDGLTTVGAVLQAIETSASNVLGARYTTLYHHSAFATLDQTRKSFAFVDRTGGEVGPFTIASLNNSNIGLAGVGLGIYGSSDQPNAKGELEIVGTPLHDDSLSQRLYLVSTAAMTTTPANRPMLGGSVTVTASDIDASMKVLIAEAGVKDGSGTARSTVQIVMDGAAASDGKITLQELFDAVESPSTLDAVIEATGSMNIVLPVSAKVPWLPASTTASGDIVVSWPDISDVAQLQVTHTGGLDQLLKFADLDSQDVATALDSVVEYLSRIEQFGFLREKLPVLNRSLTDLVGLGAEFTRLLENFKQQPVQTLLQLETAMEAALGVL